MYLCMYVRMCVNVCVCVVSLLCVICVDLLVAEMIRDVDDEECWAKCFLEMSIILSLTIFEIHL